MQKWEYCHVFVQEMISEAIFYKVNEIIERRIKRDKAFGDCNDEDAGMRFIAQLGFEGWEAVGLVGDHDILFKRPIE